MKFDVETFDVAQYDAILARGLSSGVGDRDGQMCIEAAICAVLGLGHGDDPGCVAVAVREYKIRLNDSVWSSEAARADGLRDLGLAQLGSLGVVDDREFAKLLAEKTIRVLIPQLFRDVLADDLKCQEAANRCEAEGTSAAASAAEAAYAAAARAAAARAADAAYAASAADADNDSWLRLSAELALEVLIELDSPGCRLLI